MSRRGQIPDCAVRFRRCARLLLIAVLFLISVAPRSVQACAACYGQSDSPLAAGMNWGILSLLVVITSVLGGVAAFFVFLVRKSVAAPDIAVGEQGLQPVQEG